MEEHDLEKAFYMVGLLKRRLQGETLEPDQRKELDRWLAEDPADREKILDDEYLASELKHFHSTNTEARLTQLNRRVSQINTVHHLRRWAAIAAIVLFTLGAGFWFYKQSHIKDTTNPVAVNDVAPGTNKAVLTLSSGKAIQLSQAQSGIVSQGQRISYENGKALLADSASDWAVLSTPRGGEYHVTLADGTKVWLNAASSLKYPTSFNSLKNRTVELTGEAYFEVAHDKAHPFLVKSAGQTVEVLGTHFNVMDYPDEQAGITTLLQGSVKISRGKKYKVISPGEQAVAGDGIKVIEADVDAAVAWHNGRTYFKDADIKTIMRALSRWYNIDVEYRGEPGKELFTGGISRKSNLSGLLKILVAGDVHATIENGKLIVIP